MPYILWEIKSIKFHNVETDKSLSLRFSCRETYIIQSLCKHTFRLQLASGQRRLSFALFANNLRTAFLCNSRTIVEFPSRS